jgi:integrase
MNGSVRQRGAASWELRVYSGIDPDSGKRRYRTATVVGNRSDADRGLTELVASVRSERSIGSASTVSELLEAWFVVASGSWAPTTIRQTRSVVDRYLHPQLGILRVGELTPSVIDAAYVRLRVSGGSRGQGLSAGTLARVHVVLRSALAQAQRWGWIFDNPVERAHRIKVRKTDRQTPTPDEVAKLIGWLEVHEPLLHLFVAVAVSTGARRAQLLALRWSNVDLVRGRVAFVGGWVEGPHGPVLSDTKTSRRHQVQIDSVTLTMLSARATPTSDGFIFSDDGGQSAWKPNRATKCFLRALDRAGIRRFRLHDLRHFMATELLQAGVALAVVSQRLDHQRKSTTLDYYAHAVQSGDLHAADMMRSILDNATQAA